MNTRNIGNEAKINPKTGRIDQACERYGVGRSTMRRIAEESGAVVRVGRTYLINYSSSILLRMWGACSIYNEPVYRVAVPVCA